MERQTVFLLTSCAGLETNQSIHTISLIIVQTSTKGPLCILSEAEYPELTEYSEWWGTLGNLSESRPTY